MIGIEVHHLLAQPIGTIQEVRIEEGLQCSSEDVDVVFLRGTVELLRTDYGLFAQGEISACVKDQCVRCLIPISYPLTIHLADHFAYNPQTFGHDGEGVFPIKSKRLIDLAPALREHTFLDLPNQLLCRPDCQGLCSQCGTDLNQTQCDCTQEETDPRLAVLKALL